MTGRELKQILDSMSNEELDKGLYYSYPSRDYWHTTIAGDITSIDEGFIEYSEYHSKMTVADEPEQDEDFSDLTDAEIAEKCEVLTEKLKKVLILS